MLLYCNKRLISAIWSSLYLKQKKKVWDQAGHFLLQAIGGFSVRHLQAVSETLYLSTHPSPHFHRSPSTHKSHSGILSDQWSMLAISPSGTFQYFVFPAGESYLALTLSHPPFLVHLPKPQSVPMKFSEDLNSGAGGKRRTRKCLQAGRSSWKQPHTESSASCTRFELLFLSIEFKMFLW